MSTLLPQRYREPGARAMPPLTWVGERFAPRATWSCIDDLYRSPVALALRVYPPSQGSGLAASLAPRPWHGQRFSTSTEPQAQEGCLMSLSALLSTSLLPLSILRTGSKQLLNETDPLSLRS